VITKDSPVGPPSPRSLLPPPMFFVLAEGSPLIGSPTPTPATRHASPARWCRFPARHGGVFSAHLPLGRGWYHSVPWGKYKTFYCYKYLSPSLRNSGHQIVCSNNYTPWELTKARCIVRVCNTPVCSGLTDLRRLRNANAAGRATAVPSTPRNHCHCPTVQPCSLDLECPQI
jgi:hypothetical protein